jgi:hypothetical protein
MDIQARADVGIGFMVGDLEGAENPATQFQRVVDRLHPGCVLRELRVA